MWTRMLHSLALLSSVLLSATVHGFSSLPYQQQHLDLPSSEKCPGRRPTVALQVARYGPPPADPSAAGFGDDEDDYDEETRQQQQAFRVFLKEAVATSAKNPDHLPRLMANHIDLIMSLHGADGVEVINELLQEAKSDGNPQLIEQLTSVIEVVLSFAEELVEQATEFDDHNKHLLGKIIKAMRNTDAASATALLNNPNAKEEALDRLLQDEKHNFTPGFLRHIEGECIRISNAPRMSKESARLLEILRMIQTRVLEELGKDIGEAALVLGQLLGYDSDEELLGVLDAGLTVRGRDFALEMQGLTKEALDGFQRVPGGTDPGLVERITLIDRHLQDYLEEGNAFM